ncbi:MAG: sugar transferase [Bacteriovoracales bacterium]|nr:sugar transferase [Bacteriovoracales bacterium]
MEIFLLFVLDIISIALAFIAIRAVRFSPFDWSFQIEHTLHILCPISTILFVNYIFDFYRTDMARSLWRIPAKMIFTSTISFVVISFQIYLFFGLENFMGDYFGRGILLGVVFGFSFFASIHRMILHKVFEKVREKRSYLVFANERELNVITQENERHLGVNRLNLCIAGDLPDLPFRMNSNKYAGLLVGMDVLQDPNSVKTLMSLRLHGVKIFTLHDLFEKFWFKIPISNIKDQWFVVESGFSLLHNPVGQKIKRVLDLIFSTGLLLFSFPLIVLISLILKLTGGNAPVIYRQIRMGERGKNFVLYKFRSMFPNAESEGAVWASKDDPRATKFGKLLRKTRLDELPQLWNVLKGEMSFIGPRPERPEFYSELGENIPYYNLRHLVRPGITGWAQVCYPYGACIEDALEKLQYDFFYIKNYSLILDVKIIIKTMKIVLFGRGR